MELKVDVKTGGAWSESVPLGTVPPCHGRSLSLDNFTLKMNFGSKTQPSSSKGPLHVFSLEFGNGEFTPAEMEKIVVNEKLVEIVLSDPKRVKRILANRPLSSRSKERKMRYISELLHRVQNLQSETSTPSAQVTLLQRDSTGLTNQNNDLKFRLQAMEQQAQLQDDTRKIVLHMCNLLASRQLGIGLVLVAFDDNLLMFLELGLLFILLMAS